MAAAGTWIVEARDLHKSFGSRPVLAGVELQVRRGETLVILGGSGSGKSTLLRCLIGLERPDRGTVRIAGADVYAADPATLRGLRERMGMAFQAGALFGSMTLAENIELPLLEFSDLPATTRRIVARIKLGLVGLEEAMDLYPSQLSGGMRKRAALARALALDPDVLFFDEPSAGLDPVTAAGLDRLLTRMKGAHRVTFVVVTHELESAFAVADRLALMHDGRFRVVGSPAEVRASDDPVVRGFLDRRPPPALEGTSRLTRWIAGEAGPAGGPPG